MNNEKREYPRHYFTGNAIVSRPYGRNTGSFVLGIGFIAVALIVFVVNLLSK